MPPRVQRRLWNAHVGVKKRHRIAGKFSELGAISFMKLKQTGFFAEKCARLVCNTQQKMLTALLL